MRGGHWNGLDQGGSGTRDWGAQCGCPVRRQKGPMFHISSGRPVGRLQPAFSKISPLTKPQLPARLANQPSRPFRTYQEHPTSDWLIVSVPLACQDQKVEPLGAGGRLTFFFSRAHQAAFPFLVEGAQDGGASSMIRDSADVDGCRLAATRRGSCHTSAGLSQQPLLLGEWVRMGAMHPCVMDSG